ncbi:hypothetical protein [Amycolatopsis plumensis]|uniref:hypothetical protein n=1 Tax=Amycolatopsis plumensis TaxID=236508 RepID=UPI00360C67D4
MPLDAALAAPERITRLVLLGSGLTGQPRPDHMPADVRTMAEATIRYLVTRVAGNVRAGVPPRPDRSTVDGTDPGHPTPAKFR